jgi:integrase
MRYQDPQIERSKGRRPAYVIRPYVRVVTADGKITAERRRIRLGYCHEMTLKEAKLRKQEIMATINGGQISIAAQIPLRQVIARFRAAHMPALAATTRAKYENHLRNHVEPDLGGLKLGEIDRSVVAEWLMAKTRLSKSTRLDLRNLVASIFKCAEEWRIWQGPNPAHRAPVGRGGAPARQFAHLTEQDVLRWLDCIGDTSIMPAWRAKQLAQVCLLGGLRVSEALGLRWRDVDVSRRTIRVERRFARGDVDEPKSRASRRERYIGTLADEIVFHRPAEASDDDPIFCRKDGTMPDDRDLQQHIWRPAAQMAGIYHPGFGLHSLRRLSITWRQQCGATLIEAMRQAGHTRPDMTARYTLDDLRREAQIVDRLRRRLLCDDGMGHNGTKFLEAGAASA